MCYTAYRFVDCYRRLDLESEHTVILHRHPNKNWDDPQCMCQKVHDKLDRHLPCPGCLKQILLRTQLQQRIQEEEAGTGKYVELDYTKRPVFESSSENSPKTGSKTKVDVAVATKQFDRRRQNTRFFGTEELKCIPNIELPEHIENIDENKFEQFRKNRLALTGKFPAKDAIATGKDD
ncbi:hypothetical protein TWF694_000361 [Orbilia ellipsospora]|uniref:Uncharacterized protein n=1 Tax=Orbilia ellipsospora TaxID=2528407 RepID=A0AAV9XNQ4_9PEZI